MASQQHAQLVAMGAKWVKQQGFAVVACELAAGNCRDGLADLPPGWGLLHAQGARVVEVLRPLGNMWPGPGSELRGWTEFQHPVNEAAERGVLFSIARRLTEAQPRRPGGPPPTPQSLP